MKEQVHKFWEARNPRERVLLAGLGLFAAFAIVWPAVVQPVVKAFRSQREALEQITLTYAGAPDALKNYARLVARRQELEKFYGGVDLSSDPLSYLEKLITETAKVPSGGYTVSPRDTQEIGKKYRHKIFLVKFPSSSMENVANFLQALTTGPQPMLISQINFDKRTTAENLDVTLEVSGFEAISPVK